MTGLARGAAAGPADFVLPDHFELADDGVPSDDAEDELAPAEAEEVPSDEDVSCAGSLETVRLSVSELTGRDEAVSAALDDSAAAEEESALSAAWLPEVLGADSCDAGAEAYAKTLSDEPPDACAPDAFRLFWAATVPPTVATAAAMATAMILPSTVSVMTERTCLAPFFR